MAHIRTAAEARNGQDYPEWQSVIWDANEIAPDTFGRPDHLGPWWAGGSVEEYPDARVLHRGDGSVSIVSKTEKGDEVLRAVAAKRGINLN
jgi:hypothetical protein